MTDRALIAEWLRATGGAAFEWGQCDCATWAADLVSRACGRDPAAGWRGAYRTRFEAVRFVARAGGLHALVAPQMRGHGPAAAGCGVAVAQVAGVQVCGVLIDGALVVKTDRGLAWPSAFEIVEGWELCRKH